MSTQYTNVPRRHILFGPFAFDVESGELRKHGVRLRLQGQPLQILATLVSQPGQLVNRDDFRNQLWTESTFVDFDHGLNAAMNRLRQVLGDSADQPRYIETLTGRGYRFIAEVEDRFEKPDRSLTPPADSSESALQRPQGHPWREEGTTRPNRNAWRWWAVPTFLICGAVVWLLAVNRPSPSTTQPLRFGILPPDGFALEAGSSRQTFALSPDGRRLAFTAMDASGIFQMFVRELDQLDARALPNAKGAYTVFWAPDGRSLFMTMAGSLRRSTLTDDSYQVLCDSPAITMSGALVGANLLISARSANYIVPIAGGTPQAIQETYQWPHLLPDGRHLVYTAFDAKLGRHRGSVVKYGEPKTARALLETDSRLMYAPSMLKPGTGYLMFVRAGNLLAQPFDPRSKHAEGEPLTVVSRVYSFFPTGAADFSVADNGMLAYKRYVSRSQLAWVNRRGEVLRRVGPGNVNLKQARLSPDGKKIATPIFDVSRGVNDMWIIDTETGTAKRTIPGRGLVDNPVWSPDSRTLAFNRVYDSPPKIYLRGLGEHDDDEPLLDGYFQAPRDWSHDGRFLAIANTAAAEIDKGMKGDVWLVDMARGRKAIHLIRTPFHEDNAAFSPDGRWLAFTSNESGQTEVYLQAFEASDSPRLVGPRHLVSRQGGSSLRWRRDGKELFYLGLDGNLHVVSLSLSPSLSISPSTPLFPIGTEVRAAMHSVFGFDVSPDGQRILLPIIDKTETSEIVVIQNWEEALRTRGNTN